MPHVIVEYEFDPPITEAECDAMADQLQACLDARDVRWVESFLSLDRRNRICIFEAPDAEAVRSAYRSAKVGFVRAWAAEAIRDDDE
jgi:hypothetical protein